MAAEDPQTLLTTGPAARRLELCADTIRAAVKTGKLPATRTATGMLLFRLADLDAFAESRRRRRCEARDSAA